MADANPASNPVPESKVAKSKKAEAGPEIQYFGEGAEKIKFEVDPKAALIRVYSTGMVLVDY